MKKLLILAILASILPLAAQRTTRSKLRPEPVADHSETSAAPTVDTVVPTEAHLVDLNGYDKPLRSRRETFFTTNNGEREVCALAYTIKYYDTAGRMLHSASHHSATSIPPTETRQLSIRSWDAQNAFYYRLSTAPERVAQATPYDVRITVDTIFYKVQ